MKKIVLLSDTHSALDERFLPYLEDVNEIWHAGDIGNIGVLENLEKITKVRAVYGNIDNHIIRSATKEFINFKCEEVNVLITHIGGYPGKYTKGIKEKIQKVRPKLFICGHSHILKVIFDKKFNLLHMNPGAAGNYGVHKVKTILKFKIDKENITDLKVIELKR
jgi:putative phosphoesterase